MAKVRVVEASATRALARCPVSSDILRNTISMRRGDAAPIEQKRGRMATRSGCSTRGALLGLLLVLPYPLQAQQSQAPSVDAIAPVVKHEPVADEVEAGTPLSISATVTDNVAVARVTLFYRARGEADYRRISMKRLGATDMFVATLDTDAVREPALEYYIEAADAASNILLVGYAFSPLAVAVSAVGTMASTDQAAPPPPVQVEKSGSNTWLWVLMGVGVAAIAAGASGGGGGGSSGDSSIVIDGPLPQ